MAQYANVACRKLQVTSMATHGPWALDMAPKQIQAEKKS